MARKLGLALEDIVEAAAEIADAHGIEAVTLAAVAERLGVRSPSLYAHVEGLDGLRRHLALFSAAALAQQLAHAAERHTGTAALEAIAHAYRRFARKHPGWYAATQRAVRPGEDDELYDALASCVIPVFTALGESGVAAHDRVHFTRAFRAAIHGFVTLEEGRGFGMPEAVDESYARLVQLLTDGVVARAGARKSARTTRATTTTARPSRR